MTSQRRRTFHIGGASWLLLCAAASGAMAEDPPAPAAPPPAASTPAPSTQLPEINVTAPSPIVHHRHVVPAKKPVRTAGTARAPNRERTAQPQPASAPAPAAPQQGVLPIVTDQFATVTVVPNEEIRRAGGAQLGDLLFSKPGITGSTFAPGASSRPIIRGLDVNRVGIVENATTPAGRPISAKTISCRSIRSPRTRLRSFAAPRRSVMARPRSAASSVRPTTAFLTLCPRARPGHSRPMD